MANPEWEKVLDRGSGIEWERGGGRPAMSAVSDAEWKERREVSRRRTLPEFLASKLPTGASRDLARMATHGLARTGNTFLRALDVPNRLFGNRRSLLQGIYERSERNLDLDRYDDPGTLTQLGEAAVGFVSTAGVLGRTMAPVLGTDTAASTVEVGRRLGAGEAEATAAGVSHGARDAMIWSLVRAYRALRPREPAAPLLLPEPPEEVPFALKAGRTRRDVRAAEEGGDAPEPSGNFLATDRVPESIFGFRIVGPKGYTKADLAFFKEHPEAGGYYDMEGAATDEER